MIRKTLTYLLTAPLLLAASCVSEEGLPPTVVIDGDDTYGDMTLRLKLDMGLDAANASRADKGDEDGYEDPSGAFEEISSLRVFILHGEDREVENWRKVETTPDGKPVSGDLSFKVKSNEMKTIVLIANEETLPAPTSSHTTTATEFLDQFANKGTKISSTQWNQLRSWIVSIPVDNSTGNVTVATKSLFSDMGNDAKLPLTEIFQVYAQPTQITNGSETQEVRLFLTRTAAKATFEFYVSDSPTNPHIGSKVTAISIGPISQSEFVFPRDDTEYSKPKYSSEGIGYINMNVGDGNRFITYFEQPEDTPLVDKFIYTLADPVTLTPVTDTDQPISTQGPIYFPESILATAGDRFKVSVEIGGVWLEAKALTDNILHFSEDGGDVDAIARNTHLKIKINFTTEPELGYEVELVPYTSIVLKPGFGFSDLITKK